MPENALCSDVVPKDNQTRENQLTIQERLEDLESKMDDIELFLAGLLLWLVLALYQEVVVVGLIGSFVVSILIFSMALFAGDKT